MTNLTEQYRKLEQDFFSYQKMLNEANKDLNKYYFENTKLKETLKLMRSKIKEVYDLNKYEFKIEGVFTEEDIMQIDQVLADNQIQANTVACNKIQENNNG